MRSRAIRLTILLCLVILAVVLPSAFSGGAREAAPQQAVAYAPGPEEVESLASLEGFMHARMTYPTGRFDQRWLLKAAEQAELVRAGVPAGVRPTYKPGTDSVRAATALNAESFTSLGPQPQESTGCQAPCFTFGFVSGRVNAISIQTQGYTPGAGVAYFGSDGGGVWKTTNCCTPTTTWAVTTDGPNISTTSISDIAIDPNDPKIVYAATGDLSFGSFAFGSAGVLKSTNGHLPASQMTWEVLGANVFTPVYPQAAGVYPQYQAVSKVRVDPNDSQKVIVGTKTGLFFSYNGGANWTGPCLTNAFSGQRQDVTDLITVDSGSATDLYAAIGARGFATTVQPNLGLNGANGIYKTTVPASGCPAPASWTLISTPANGWPTGTGGGVGCDPPIGNLTELCAANENKLGRIEMAVAPSTTTDVDPATVTIYAEVQAVDPHTPCGALTVLGDTTSRGCFLGLWRTTNSGTTWTQQADHHDLNFSETPTAGPCGEDTPQNWYNQGVAVDPTNPNVLFMDAIDIWKSNDGGVTLTDISCGYHTGLNPVGAPVHVDNHALTYAPPVGGAAATMLAGNDGGIYVTQNANVPPAPVIPIPGQSATFKDLNETVSTIEFYSGDISANFATSSNAFIVGGAQDNGSSFHQFAITNPPDCPPAGCKWTQRIGGDGMFARIEPKGGQRVFMESQVGNLQRSTSGPAGPYSAVPQPWTADRVSFIMPYEIDKFACPTTTCDHMIAGSHRVWESIDGGSSWYSNSPDLTKGTLGDRSFINQLSYAHLSNGRAIVGTNDGNVQYGFGLGTGTTDDAEWVNVTAGNAVLPNRPILDVVMSPTSNLVGYAAVGGFTENTPSTPGHVYQLTCGNTVCSSFSWADKSGNLPNIPANSILVNPNVPKQVFVGTDWGLYYTDDVSVASPTWFHFQEGLPSTMIWDMAIDRGATTLAVFTRSRGAFAWLLPTTSPNLATIFVDDFEPTPIAGWTPVNESPTCRWTLTTEAHSPSNAWTTSPYPNDCETDLISPPIVVVAGTTNLKFHFWEKHFTEAGVPCGGTPESNCDLGIVSYSTDNGATYNPIPVEFEGGTPADPYRQVTLDPPGNPVGTLRIKFTFDSDSTVSAPPYTGWFIDDVSVTAEVPTSVSVASFAAKAGRQGVKLTWRTKSEIGLLGYNVWRFRGAKGVKVNRTLIAAKGRTGGAAYSLVDRRAKAAARYTYKLQVVAASGKRTWRGATTVRVTR